MPSMQEEMNKVLTEWNQPESKPMTQPTTKNQFPIKNNVTRITFNYVKANPGTTAAQAAAALRKQGYKESSVTAIMAQLARQGACRKERYKYYVTQDEYTPLKGWRKTEKLAKAQSKAPQPQPQAPQAPVQAPTITVQHIVESMTMRDARALYIELGKYFGA